MKTKSIIAAIVALRAADARLSDGRKQGDTVLALDCFAAASWLEAQLIEQFPDVQVKEAA